MHVYLFQQLYDRKELVDLKSLKIIQSLDSISKFDFIRFQFTSVFDAVIKKGIQTPDRFGRHQIKKSVLTPFGHSAARDIILVAGCHRHKFHRRLYT